MRTEVAPSDVPAEQLSWPEPVLLHAESRAPLEDEPGVRGFRLRVHADPGCGSRLIPDGVLVPRRYDDVRAEALCCACGDPLLPGAGSSVLRRLREAERTLLRLRDRAADGPMPREAVHCRALRYEAEHVRSRHPAVPELADRVVALAGEVAEVLRQALTSYDRRR